MTFEEYQKRALTSMIYPEPGKNFVYPTLGLTGEAGEVSEKVKKILRDQGGILTTENRAEIAKELGDVLWYIAALAYEIKVPLEVIAETNIEKLESRVRRNMISGSGDNR